MMGPMSEVSESDEAAQPGIRSSYAEVATVGYVIYGLGAAGPYLRTQLGLSDAEVGLHSTALAIGLVVAGIMAASLARRFGELTVRAAGIALVAIAVPVLAAAPAFAASIVAALLLGLGGGTILGYANATLGAPGGRRARLGLARASLWAMVAAFGGPIVVAAGASVGPGWWLGLVPAIGLLAVVALDLRSGPRFPAATPGDAPQGRLPRTFWLTWVFLVAAISIEFSAVFWGATLVERRTNVTLPEATAIASLFLGGMFTGRLGLSLGLGASQETRASVALGLAVTAVGTGLVWVSTVAVLSAVGLFLAGLGVAILYPLGAAAAMSAAPGQLALAGNRLTLASGVAILAAPFALGAIADAAGVVTGWGLVLALVAVAFALVPGLPRGRPGAAGG
jgi:MFS family permease